MFLPKISLFAPGAAHAAASFVNAGASAAAASGNITLGAPASPATDDIWIATIHSRDQVAHTLTDWTQIVQANGGQTVSRLSVWYFRYAGSTPNLVVGHTAGDTIVGGIAAFRGLDTNASPVDTAGTIAAGTTGVAGVDLAIEHTTITPSTSNTMLLAINGFADNQARDTIPTGFAAAFDPAGNECYLSNLGGDGSVALHYKVHGSGATGEIVDTLVSSGGTELGWAAVLIALEAVPDSTGGTRRRAQ